MVFGFVSVWHWAIAGSEVLRAELAEPQLAATRAALVQYECMGNAMLVKLPATRTRVRIDITDALWSQRLTEIGYPRHDIVSAPGDADYLVTLAPEAGECGAPMVIVTPLR